MIHLNIEGKSWPEVTEQLANLAREHQVLGDEAKELGRLQGELTEAKAEINLLRSLVKEKDTRIAELEALRTPVKVNMADPDAIKPVKEAPAENPTTAAESEPGTRNSVAPTNTEPAAETAPAPATSEQPTYKKEEVREFLAECRNKGVNITDVLKPFGGRFPVVDEEDYPALMEAAKKALADKGAK